MSGITYIRGDATVPLAKGTKVIAHVCNDIGGWGKGFVLALSRRWPEPERAYRAWHRDRARNDFALGAVQRLSLYGQDRAPKGRGELREQPRTSRRRPLPGGPTARGSRPTRRSRIAMTVYDHGEGGG
ncbi:Appr-1-p processing protein [Streptomyces sp. NPDC020192]|uniref:Appr-1-p processing protein n=1 Tax=Streptomyces sp. NPDC020192 TaxID=3365066 RepID=UPI003791F1F1